LTKESIDNTALRQSWKGVNNKKRLQALPTERAHESYGKLTRQRERELFFFCFCK